jgi:hypothetical protein
MSPRRDRGPAEVMVSHSMEVCFPEANESTACVPADAIPAMHGGSMDLRSDADCSTAAQNPVGIAPGVAPP